MEYFFHKRVPRSQVLETALEPVGACLPCPDSLNLGVALCFGHLLLPAHLEAVLEDSSSFGLSSMVPLSICRCKRTTETWTFGMWIVPY